MKDKSIKGKQISRRSILPILGSVLLIPFLGFGKNSKPDNKESKLKTLLRADGSSVQVDENVVKNAKIIKKGMSNQSLLQWLKPHSKK